MFRSPKPIMGEYNDDIEKSSTESITTEVPKKTLYLTLFLCFFGDFLAVGALLLAYVTLYNNHYIGTARDFQSGRGYELHVTETIWPGIKGKFEVAKYLCHKDKDFGCGTLLV